MNQTEHRGTLSFAVAGILNLLFLLILNAHDRWRPWLDGLVTERFGEVLWAVNLGLVIQIFGNFILSVERTRMLERIMEVGFSIAALIGALAFYRVFPMDLTRFGDNAVVLVRVVFFVGVVAASMAIVVNLIRLMRTPELRANPPKDSRSGA